LLPPGARWNAAKLTKQRTWLFKVKLILEIIITIYRQDGGLFTAAGSELSGYSAA